VEGLIAATVVGHLIITIITTTIIITITTDRRGIYGINI